jgi:ABC-type dipeptide/oligopeptide/nickel transport system permease subunit
MKLARYISLAAIGVVFLACLAAGWVAPADYAHQFREAPNAAPTRHFLLGTDDLGRDRFSRLLYGGRVSLLLAPAAALLSTALAGIIGGLAGFLGGRWERTAMACTDLFMSLPWLFLLITVRAVLPLNVAPAVSVLVTFALLGALGWAASARVICAGARTLRTSDFVLTARAAGCTPARILTRHVLPNLRPALAAQFLISIPVFILAEANLSMLGLGVSEPLPSWGGLLRELQNYSDLGAQPWRLAPLLLLIVVVSGFQVVLARDEVLA